MLEQIHYGESLPGDRRPAFISGMGFEETLSNIEAGIADADFWVIHRIDPQALVRRAGYGMLSSRQILFFHPRFMSKLLAINPAAIVEAPLKYVVLEYPDRSVRVHAPEPLRAFSRYAGLNELGEELGELCEPITARAGANARSGAAR